MKINHIKAFTDNYIWTIEKNGYCFLVDPGDPILSLNYLANNSLKLAGILITHHHPDHTGGNKELSKHFKIPIYGPSKENIPTLTNKVRNEDTINLKEIGVKLKVIEIPGHTSGHIAYYTKGFLFSGDTIFSSGCGRLFEGTPAQMFQSLKKISELPDDTKVFCTHEYTLTNIAFSQEVEPSNFLIEEKKRRVIKLLSKNEPSLPTSIALEKDTNPFLRTRKEEIKNSVSAFSKKNLANEIEVFKELRIWKDNY